MPKGSVLSLASVDSPRWTPLYYPQRKAALIDLHTHILPSLDDGAQTEEEALAMAQVAQGDGITTLVATPHSLEWTQKSSRTDMLTRTESLNATLARHGIGLKVLPGLENYLTPDLAKQCGNGLVLTLNGGPYLLLELPLQQFPVYTEQVIFELQLKGIIPILAHPERNVALQKDPNLLHKLVERGVLAQITAASLMGNFGSAAQKAAEIFLRRRLVQIIASDAHSTHGPRNPVLTHGVAAATKIAGQEQAQAMVTTIPQTILAGQPVKVEPPLAASPKRAWAFWQR
ncbi:MAG: hypothetical protein HY664_02845 [Chloroflexi bacterium]|nr:hypothetical protein [Chloroflexota bacterium]